MFIEFGMACLHLLVGEINEIIASFMYNRGEDNKLSMNKQYAT